MKRWLPTVVALVALLATASASRAQNTEAILDSLQYTGFHYFWDLGNPANGLCPDRSTPGSVCSIASTGFGLSAITVGIDHGWISRSDGAARVRTTLNTFWTYPQGPGTSGVIGYNGLFYHWLDMTTGLRRVDWNAELSTIDTALLFAGIMHCHEYFDGGDTEEVAIRALADSITRRADWNFMRNGAPGLEMGWLPTTGFSSFGRWIGYNEAMIMYIMAIGSPTHPIPGTDWNTWLSGYSYGQFNANIGPYVQFPPLFGHQYSHCWIDFRTARDAYMQLKGSTYFENSRRATLSQIGYARQRGDFEQFFPGNHTYAYGESDSLWGFTASDDPSGYVAHGAPSGTENGTIAPTAAITSLVFCPDSVWRCVLNMWNNRNTVSGGKVFSYWGPYGFGDAFNPEQTPWFDTAVLGIDQGPIVVMLENYRTGGVWSRFMTHPDIVNGMSLAGFVPVPTAVNGPGSPRTPSLELAAIPNPFRAATTLRYSLAASGRVRLTVYDVGGRAVARPVDGVETGGAHEVQLAGEHLPAGVYEVRLDAGGASLVRRAVLLR